MAPSVAAGAADWTAPRPDPPVIYQGGDCYGSSPQAPSPFWSPNWGSVAWRTYFRGEYLLWWTDGAAVIPLVTMSPTTVDREVAGVLGRPGTTVLFGGTRLNDEAQSGQRFTLGAWLGPCRELAFEVTYMGLGRQKDGFSAVSPGDPVLARPYFNVETGAQDADLVAFPQVLSGSVAVSVTTDLDGLEMLFRRPVTDPCAWQLDLLTGYRYQRLRDDLTIREAIESLDESSGIAVGTTIDLADRFKTDNEFHGWEIGLASRRQYCRWGLELAMKLALGNTQSEVLIDGSRNTVTVGGASSQSGAGLLALPTNIGTYRRDDFTMIPELGATLTYDVTERLRLTFGYTLVYWSKVARAGDQIDPDLNLSQLLPPGEPVGAPRPEFSWMTTDFWAQGMHFGLDYRF